MVFIDIVRYLGIFVFAVAGALKARGARLDVFGGLVVAFISAYGGGTIRDILLGVSPVSWINDNLALVLVVLGAATTFLLKDKLNNFRRTIFFTDAIGLGLFTATGIGIADKMGVNEFYSLVMGTITACFGGLVADIFCGIPAVLLRKGELYATASVAGGVVFILGKHFLPVGHETALLLCIITVVAMRIYSKRKRLTLPNI